MPESTTVYDRSDKRFKLVEATMRRNGYRPDALVETLHTVQTTFGFLDDDLLRFVAEKLPVSPSQIYGVATFYHYFTMKPAGKHTCAVCTGTACYIKGTDKVMRLLEEDYDLRDGETTSGDEISVMTVRCIGACGLAPVAVFDGEVIGDLELDTLKETFERWLADG
ncbi:MAG: bidirectional hydrogenase complex protein HoxE [Chloroflexota bacterium]